MDYKINTIEALETLRPKAQWVLRGDELEWLDEDQTQPTEEEIAAEMLRLQTEYDANEYSRLRKEEYNKLNQYELQFDDLTNGTNTWEAAILEIKAKYPKGVL